MATKKWKTPKHPNHELMAKHGWEHIESDNHDEGRVHIYQHDRLGMMEVHHPSGDWDHQDGSRNTSGTDHSSLTKHLHSIHGIESQHAENDHHEGVIRIQGSKKPLHQAQSKIREIVKFHGGYTDIADNKKFKIPKKKYADFHKSMVEHGHGDNYVIEGVHDSQHAEEPETPEPDVNLTKHPHIHTPGYFAPPVSISQGRDEDEQFAEKSFTQSMEALGYQAHGNTGATLHFKRPDKGYKTIGDHHVDVDFSKGKWNWSHLHTLGNNPSRPTRGTGEKELFEHLKKTHAKTR